MGIVSARDMYLLDKGRLFVTLLNIFKLAGRLKQDDHNYAIFKVIEIEYNIPKKY